MPGLKTYPDPERGKENMPEMFEVRLLESYLPPIGVEPAIGGPERFLSCPDCNEEVIPSSGCFYCLACGYHFCGC